MHDSLNSHRLVDSKNEPFNFLLASRDHILIDGAEFKVFDACRRPDSKFAMQHSKSVREDQQLHQF